MQASQIIEKSKNLISNESNWCKGHFALSFNGIDVAEDSPAACKWCAHGAVSKIMKLHDIQHGTSLYMSIWDYLGTAGYRTTGRSGLISLNDNSDHQTVLAVFDKAIKLAKHNEN